MVNTVENFTQEVVTERELKRLAPDWPPSLIRDYIELKRNVVITADARDVTEATVLNNAQEIAGNETDIGKLRVINAAQDRKIKADRQLIAELLTDNGKLVARLNLTDKKIKNINQLQADF